MVELYRRTGAIVLKAVLAVFYLSHCVPDLGSLWIQTVESQSRSEPQVWGQLKEDSDAVALPFITISIVILISTSVRLLETSEFHLAADLGPVTEAECCSAAFPSPPSRLGRRLPLLLGYLQISGGETSCFCRDGLETAGALLNNWHHFPVHGLHSGS